MSKDDRPPHAFGYIRISTNEVHQPSSLDTQRQQIARYAAWKFLDPPAVIADIFEDQCSGSVPLFERPDGLRLFEHLHPGDHIVIARVDRGFRDTVDCAVSLKKLKEMGVNLHILELGVVVGPSDKTGMGEMIVTIMALMAEMDKRKILNNTMAGTLASKRLGRVQTKGAAIGWKPQKRKDGKRYCVPNHEERALCTELYTRCKKGSEKMKDVRAEWAEKKIKWRGRLTSTYCDPMFTRMCLAYEDKFPMYGGRTCSTDPKPTKESYGPQ
jgi:putative DNA-invertase from lambdoid prophage Rac